MSDRWPRLMLRETAAAYCDMTPGQFDRQCPVAPIDQGWRGRRWDQKKLDAWIDNLPARPAPELDGPIPEAPETPPHTAEARRRASLARI